MQDIKNRELKDNELEAATGGCYYKHDDGSITEVHYDDAPNEGIATFVTAQRHCLSVGGKEWTCIIAVTGNGLTISGIMMDDSDDWGSNQLKFKKIDMSTKGGFAQNWFYNA